jgi:hypothetical protein
MDMRNITHQLNLVIITLALLLEALSQVQIAAAESNGNQAALPTLAEFSASVLSSNPTQVTGIYAPGVMALPVVQQPAGQTGFVSNTPETITQFAAAGRYGSTGLLAHNTLAGRYFPILSDDSIIALVYGDGHTQYFRVTEVKQYQALSPTSIYSQFIDLGQPNITLTSTDLFRQTYGRGDVLILQTCIVNGDEASWGRLFIIAEPVNYFSKLLEMHQLQKAELALDF